MPELSELFEQMREIEAKNKRYEFNRERLEKNIAEIKSKLAEIVVFLDEIDPKIDIKVKNRSGVKLEEIVNWFEERLQGGMKISFKDFKKAFPLANFNNWGYLTQAYAKEKGWKLKHEREGRGYKYFI
jgi:hypothetical protein